MVIQARSQCDFANLFHPEARMSLNVLALCAKFPLTEMKKWGLKYAAFQTPLPIVGWFRLLIIQVNQIFIGFSSISITKSVAHTKKRNPVADLFQLNRSFGCARWQGQFHHTRRRVVAPLGCRR